MKSVMRGHILLAQSGHKTMRTGMEALQNLPSLASMLSSKGIWWPPIQINLKQKWWRTGCGGIERKCYDQGTEIVQWMEKNWSLYTNNINSILNYREEQRVCRWNHMSMMRFLWYRKILLRMARSVRVRGPRVTVRWGIGWSSIAIWI